MRLGLLLMVLAFGFLGCGGSWMFWVEEERAAPVPIRLDDGPGGRSRVESVPLTKEAEDLRRLRREHRELIESIPPDPTPAPTMSLTERQKVAGVVVLEHPEGVAVPEPLPSDWFDPSVGLSFYREEGGDWTARRVRQNHSHRRLFYFSGYPSGVRNFYDGSIIPVLAREMAFEAVEVLPLLGSVTPGMVSSLAYGMGWELRDGPGAVVNLWSEFGLHVEGEVHRYVVGGVMEFGVGATFAGEERVEYLEVGEWVGPVVVERLAGR